MPTEEPLISIIVPTFNEEKHIEFFLRSLKDQPPIDFETLIVDGGSNDKTFVIARQHNAKVVVLPKHGEFISRNIGAEIAKGKYLLFTSADTIFPTNLLTKIIEKFEKRHNLIALTGPGYPFDAPIFGKIEYTAYNFIRYMFARLPRPLKRFSASTNFLVVQKGHFKSTGGFVINDINADGLMGKKLLELGRVAFFLDMPIYVSARRMKNSGFLDFNRHYLYMLENFFFFFSDFRILKALKLRSKAERSAH